MSKKWYQVRESEGREFRYTPTDDTKNRNYNYINAAYFNVKGVVALVYYYHTKELIPTEPIRKSVSEYFRQYGKRRVYIDVGKNKKGSYMMQIQAYFLRDEMPSTEDVDYWFGVIKNKIHL